MFKGYINTIISICKKGAGLLLFIICSIAIYKSVNTNNNWPLLVSFIQNKFISVSFFSWACLLLLMGVNFFIESVKWRLVVNDSNPISLSKAITSVLVGQSFAFFTPNRVGEYAGRTLFLDAGNKMLGMAQMAWASYAQLLVTIFVGMIALAFQINYYPITSAAWVKTVQVLSPGVALVALLIFFYNKPFTGWLSFLNKIQISVPVKTNILALSFFRYMIFMLQYVWVAYMFNFDITIIPLLFSVAILFLCLSILPTFSISELVVRGQLLILLLAPFSSNQNEIIFLSSLIWGVNFLLPSIIGLFLLLGFKLNQ